MADFMPELTVPMGMDKKKSQIIQNLEQKIKKIASQVKSTKAGNVLVEQLLTESSDEDFELEPA